MKTPRKKALFYCRINRDDKANAGVIKKCLGQVAGLRQLAWEVDMVWFCKDGILMNDKIIVPFSRPLSPHSWQTYYFYLFQWHYNLLHVLALENFSFVYVRYEMSHFSLIQFFKKIKQANSNVKLIVEIPTYPYAKEINGFLRKLQLLLDYAFRRQLKKHVDFIASFGTEEWIYGIQTIQISNGISIDKVPFSNVKPESNTVRMIAVGYWRYWHGLDRVLEGLKDYYSGVSPTVKVFLHIIGAGSELVKLIRMAKDYSLTEWVEFTAPLIGKKLDNTFNNSDLGIGDLASHRKGLKLAFPLKHRDYAARGIPFIFATEDPGFLGHQNGVLRFKADDSAIDIKSVVAFVQSISITERESLRRHALEHFKWASVFRKIFEKAGIDA